MTAKSYEERTKQDWIDSLTEEEWLFIERSMSKQAGDIMKSLEEIDQYGGEQSNVLVACKADMMQQRADLLNSLSKYRRIHYHNKKIELSQDDWKIMSTSVIQESLSFMQDELFGGVKNPKDDMVGHLVPKLMIISETATAHNFNYE